MTSVFLFWVLGAIDGHAKNFSIMLEKQGRYKLTPLYDVISAYPLTDKRQLEWRNLKMAMSLKSKNRHYGWGTILTRHWLAAASHYHFSQTDMQSIIEEVFDNLEGVIEAVANKMSPLVQPNIYESIFSGMRKVKNR